MYTYVVVKRPRGCTLPRIMALAAACVTYRHYRSYVSVYIFPERMNDNKNRSNVVEFV